MDVSEAQGWHRRVRELYRAVDAVIDPHQDLCRLRGVCCDFRVSEHRLYATEVEVRFLIESRRARGESLPPSPDGVLCPFWVGGRCHARDERPLGCRTYFCDPSWKERGEEIHRTFHRGLESIHEEEDIPYRYREWVRALGESGAGSAGSDAEGG